MKNISLEEELYKLNDISIEYRIKDYIENIITSCVFSALKEGENSIKIELLFGELYIFVYSDSISYKFVPSESFMAKIKTSILNNEDPLVADLDDKINKKLYRIYRELLK